MKPLPNRLYQIQLLDRARLMMSRLADLITSLYSYDQDDIDKLAGKLTERRRASWINSLSDLAATHGCSQLAGTPKGTDARKLADDSRADAESIASTYNRELRNQVNRIFAANPRAQRSVYIKQLDAWAKRRDAHKTLTIALNTDGTARQFARERFYQMNVDLSKWFTASGPPPTCRLCIAIFAAGIVSFAYTQAHPFPRHQNCPHLYRAVAPTRAECGRLWLG